MEDSKLTRQITATVCYKVVVIIDVEECDNARECILDEADRILANGGIKPVVTDCSDEYLIY